MVGGGWLGLLPAVALYYLPSLFGMAGKLFADPYTCEKLLLGPTLVVVRTVSFWVSSLNRHEKHTSARCLY